jgi:osmotically-inducible protein OsmY
MRLFLRMAALVCLLTVAAWPGQTPNRGGRYDQQIRSNVARVLLSDKNYQKVSAEVEDGVVTLAGSVALDSTRRNLAVQIRHIAHVTGIDNKLVLSPPAPPDNILYGRVISRLEDAGYSDVTAQVHEGAVILSGNVRSQKDVFRTKEIVMLIPGVKEVEANLTIVSQ